MRRDEQTVEQELMEISTIQDDTIKLERIVAWCATYPDEVPFALHFFRERLSTKMGGAPGGGTDEGRG